MKTERKFVWCVRKINEEVAEFIKSNKNYVVRIFKNYKVF